ncbi:MarR family winged helix-turn-helix transcriptional regulator [Catenuloplanes sp. NPDC051500]|uniref:MarR family winged helix-turn-helix transcriptional regulator n=1 Tax=Catenuloplanes sp. NPDC051500 TaxID=3363959 RepID=UPI003792B677
MSAAAVLFHGAVAARVGLSAIEAKTADLIDRLGPLTARQIAAEAGLAPTSVTGLIDRLERKGFARRVPNPADGRGVLVEFVPESRAAFIPYFMDVVGRLQR